MSASHKRAADSERVSSTLCRSNAERLMTLSTSAVAVCCCSDSVRSCVLACTSSNRRTCRSRSTAWSAKDCSKVIVFAERIYLGAAKRDRSNALTLAQQGYAQNGAMALVAR